MTDFISHRLCPPGQPVPRCPKTGREYEAGSGALSFDDQTAMFVREKARADALPRDGERCLQTGREYEVGSGGWTRALQTARFLDELPPELKAQRHANFEALKAAQPQGKA